jgi:predicted acetyltransferase
VIENLQNFALIELTADLKEEFLAMAQEYKSAGEDRYQDAIDDFETYLAQLKKFAKDVDLPKHFVPSTAYFLLANGKLIGSGNLRHRLNDGLKVFGGHIGYNVRPAERRKGYGLLILRLTLEKARNIGLEKVFLTCDTDNIASAKIIEKHGGKLENQMIYEPIRKMISQYWIEL